MSSLATEGGERSRGQFVRERKRFFDLGRERTKRGLTKGDDLAERKMRSGSKGRSPRQNEEGRGGGKNRKDKGTNSMRSDSQEVSGRSLVESHEALGLSGLPDAVD